MILCVCVCETQFMFKLWINCAYILFFLSLQIIYSYLLHLFRMYRTKNWFIHSPNKINKSTRSRVKERKKKETEWEERQNCRFLTTLFDTDIWIFKQMRSQSTILIFGSWFTWIVCWKLKNATAHAHVIVLNRLVKFRLMMANVVHYMQKFL